MMEKIDKTEIKEIKNLLITVFKSCHSQQQIPLIIKTYKAPHISPLFSFLSCNKRGGYLEAPFRTIPVTAIPRSFKAIADF
jgi:hypothetical protein